MAKQNRDKKGNPVRFIRVNGRVVPIRDKDPSKAQTMKNYNRHGDGARQGQRIDDKYERKAQRGAYRAGAVGAGIGVNVGIGSGALKAMRRVRGVNPSTAAGQRRILRAAKSFSGRAGKRALIGAGIGFVAGHTLKYHSNKKKLAVSREREHVRTFGTTSDGRRPSKSRTGV